MNQQLAAAQWQLVATEPGAWNAPTDAESNGVVFGPMLSLVPATSASAMRDGGADPTTVDHDGLDWWWTTEFEITEPLLDPHLELGGVATHWQVWWDDALIGSGRSMFRRIRVPVPAEIGCHRIAIVCRALKSASTPRRPRASWRSLLITQQDFRWHRTSALGRIPWRGTLPAVGPWRPVTLRSGRVSSPVVRMSLHDGDAVASISGLSQPPCVTLANRPMTVRESEPGAWEARCSSEGLELWWPHTHGTPTCHDLRVESDSCTWNHPVGLRSIVADRSDDGFGLVVNGVAIHVRGACWVPPDPLALISPAATQRAALQSLVDAGLNMVRITGTTSWQDDAFFRDCDELGLMVWQDAMVHTLAPPDDPDFRRDLCAEVTENLQAISHHPSLAVFSGGSETEQQPTLWGFEADRRTNPALTEDLPRVASRVAPHVVQVTSTPTGGALPTSIRTGIAHYFGVGAYRRPLEDSRRSGVRFAAECLAFGLPPEKDFVQRHFTDAHGRFDLAAWQSAIMRDPGADWDFQGSLDYYARELFGSSAEARLPDEPEYALDLLRATAAHVFESTLTEWRRPASTCQGAIILSSRDLAPGAGWGLTDSEGARKSAWWAVARASRPVWMGCTDEGLDGIDVHVANDRPTAIMGELAISARLRTTGAEGAGGRVPLTLDAHSATTLSVDSIIGAFRDLNHAWGFGPPAYDCLVMTLTHDGGQEQTTALLGHPVHTSTRPLINATPPVPVADGWQTTIRASSFAPFVCLEAPGFTADDNWFHLAAHETRVVTLRASAQSATGEPAVSVRSTVAREAPFEGQSGAGQ